MSSLRVLGLASLLLLSLGACAPLTYSREAAVDYRRYARVRVSVQGDSGGEMRTRYLEAELREHSGFRTVTSDPAALVDALLFVELFVDTQINLSDEGTTVASTAVANYRLVATDGSVIDSGVETEEAEDDNILFPSDVGESALDGVVLHYLRPFRI